MLLTRLVFWSALLPRFPWCSGASSQIVPKLLLAVANDLCSSILSATFWFDPGLVHHLQVVDSRVPSVAQARSAG